MIENVRTRYKGILVEIWGERDVRRDGSWAYAATLFHAYVIGETDKPMVTIDGEAFDLLDVADYHMINELSELFLEALYIEYVQDQMYAAHEED
jgi:hypothetical protein